MDPGQLFSIAAALSSTEISGLGQLVDRSAI